MDFGCGTKPYRHYFNVNEYIGVEYKSDNYKYDKDCVDVYYDGKTLPFEDGHFKTIYSSEVIQQINNIDEILDEFNRVLEDKGKLLITATFLYQELMSSTDTFRYTIKGLKRLLARKGFRIIKLDKLGTANETMALLIAHYLMFKTRRNPLLKFFVYYPVLAVVSLFSNISFGSNECDDMFYIGMIILAEKTGGRKR